MQGQGWGALPPGPQVVLIQGSKDHSHNPDTALPSAGTHPIQTLAVWSDHEMGGCECERYMCTHVHACVYISLHQCTVQNCLETT